MRQTNWQGIHRWRLEPIYRRDSGFEEDIRNRAFFGLETIFSTRPTKLCRDEHVGVYYIVCNVEAIS